MIQESWSGLPLLDSLKKTIQIFTLISTTNLDNEADATAENERDLEEEEHFPEFGGNDSSDSESEEENKGQVGDEQPSGKIGDPSTTAKLSKQKLKLQLLWKVYLAATTKQKVISMVWMVIKKYCSSCSFSTLSFLWHEGNCDKNWWCCQFTQQRQIKNLVFLLFYY